MEERGSERFRFVVSRVDELKYYLGAVLVSVLCGCTCAVLLDLNGDVTQEDLAKANDSVCGVVDTEYDSQSDLIQDVNERRLWSKFLDNLKTPDHLMDVVFQVNNFRSIVNLVAGGPSGAFLEINQAVARSSAMEQAYNDRLKEVNCELKRKFNKVYEKSLLISEKR